MLYVKFLRARDDVIKISCHFFLDTVKGFGANSDLFSSKFKLWKRAVV